MVYRLRLAAGRTCTVTARAFAGGASLVAARRATTASGPRRRPPARRRRCGRWSTTTSSTRSGGRSRTTAGCTDLPTCCTPGPSSRPGRTPAAVWATSEVVEYAPERSVTLRAAAADGTSVAYVKAYAPGTVDVAELALRYDAVAVGARPGRRRRRRCRPDRLVARAGHARARGDARRRGGPTSTGRDRLARAALRPARRRDRDAAADRANRPRRSAGSCVRPAPRRPRARTAPSWSRWPGPMSRGAALRLRAALASGAAGGRRAGACCTATATRRTRCSTATGSSWSTSTRRASARRPPTSGSLLARLHQDALADEPSGRPPTAPHARRLVLDGYAIRARRCRRPRRCAGTPSPRWWPSGPYAR